jgi:hypothetical protein
MAAVEKVTHAQHPGLRHQKSEFCTEYAPVQPFALSQVQTEKNRSPQNVASPHSLGIQQYPEHAFLVRMLFEGIDTLTGGPQNSST